MTGISRARPQSASWRCTLSWGRGMLSQGRGATRAAWLPVCSAMALRVLRVDLLQDVNRLGERFVAVPVVDDDPLQHLGDCGIAGGGLLGPGVVEHVRRTVGLAVDRQI